MPLAVTHLTATNGFGTVAVAWQNAQGYDKVQVFRSSDNETSERTAWELDGEATSFVDDDPPTGTVTYEVTGAKGGLGSGEDPTVVVNR